MGWPQMGPGGFFPTNPDLANILGRADLDFEIFYLFAFLDPKFLDIQVPKFPNAQIEAWARPGRTWTCSSTPPPWLRGGSRTTKLVRSKELGQYRENPISASPVWGTILFWGSGRTQTFRNPAT